MLKPKFQKLIFSLLILPTFLVAMLAGTAMAQTATGPTCDIKKPSEWWCKGQCDFKDKTYASLYTDPKLGAAHIASCKCDGTPYLDDSALDACKNCQNPNKLDGCFQHNPIVKRINQIIYVLSGLVAVVITASVIVGGIQYAISGESANLVQAAKKRMVNSAIALVIIILMFSLLQWLIPGGL
jgi:hypothetical protein